MDAHFESAQNRLERTAIQDRDRAAELGSIRSGKSPIAILLLVAAIAGGMKGVARGDGPSDDPPRQVELVERKLSHDETLRWITEQKAWRLARKTRPIWARPVTPDEVGREFQTADHVKEVARGGSWLCAGVAGEPWFQAREKIEAKYEPDGEASKKFDFDAKPYTYRKFKPKGMVRNWVARVKGPGIKGFFIRPGYDPDRPLYSPAGGYVIMDEVPDPYRGKPQDVWLVQESLFESTYEIVPQSPKPADR
jgi:hypothetical protein